MIRLKHVIIACAIIMALFLAFILHSCNTSKRIVDKSTSETVMTDKSATTTSIAISADTNQVRTSDSQKTKESESSITSSKIKDDTLIEFVDTGGTYNANTGEATGVKNVNTSRQIEQLQSAIRDKDSEILRLKDELSASRDSTLYYKEQKDHSEKTSQNNDVTDIQETKVDWYWWFGIGAAVGIALIIFLKKFPYTKPFMIWL